MGLTTIDPIVYANRVWYRISRGAAQPDTKIWRAAVESTLPDALSRLGDRVAADPGMYPALMQSFSVTLGASGTAGEEPVNNLSPTLILSEPARSHWRVTLLGERFALKRRPHLHDLTLGYPTPDYKFYAVFNEKIYVRDCVGGIPVATALTIFGNFTPAVSSQITDELTDNLVDIGTEIVMGSTDLSSIMDAASRATASRPISQQATRVPQQGQ